MVAIDEFSCVSAQAKKAELTLAYSQIALKGRSSGVIVVVSAVSVGYYPKCGKVTTFDKILPSALALAELVRMVFPTSSSGVATVSLGFIYVDGQARRETDAIRFRKIGNVSKWGLCRLWDTERALV